MQVSPCKNQGVIRDVLLSGGIWGKSIPFPFLASRGYSHCLAHGPLTPSSKPKKIRLSPSWVSLWPLLPLSILVIVCVCECVCVWVCVCVCVCAHSVPQSCLTLCNPMDCSPQSRISQARIREWVAISSSRGSSQSTDWTWVFCISRQILYHCAKW